MLGRVPSWHQLVRGRVRGTTIALVITLGLLAVGAPTPQRTAGDELSEARAEQRALEERISEQQALVGRLERSQAALQGNIDVMSALLKETVSDLRTARRTIRSLRGELIVVQADYDRLVAEVSRLDADLARTEVEQEAKRLELRARKALLAARIRAAYEASQRSPFEALVSGASFTDLLVEASNQLDVAEQDQALAQQIRRDRETLLTIAESLAARQAQFERLRQEAAVQKAAIDTRLADLLMAERRLSTLQRRADAALERQRAAYRALAADESKLRAWLAGSERAQQRLEARIRSLVEVQALKSGIPSAFSGTMRWPMPGVVSQDYGCTGFPWEPPRGDCAHFHNGIDIVAPYGTPVRAAAAGRVLFVGYNPYDDPRDPAWLVIIAHSTSIQTWYAHMQARRPVQVGDFVEAGQVIGYEGNTGRSTAAHLDWRVMRSGDFVSPRLFL